MQTDWSLTYCHYPLLTYKSRQAKMEVHDRFLAMVFYVDYGYRRTNFPAFIIGTFYTSFIIFNAFSLEDV